MVLFLFDAAVGALFVVVVVVWRRRRRRYCFHITIPGIMYDSEYFLFGYL